MKPIVYQQEPVGTDSDSHVRLRHAQAEYGTPATMARALADRLIGLSLVKWPDNWERDRMRETASELQTLALWCATEGIHAR